MVAALKRNTRFTLKILTAITIILFSVFIIFTAATISDSIKLSNIVTKTLIKEIVSIFSPVSEAVYWGQNDQIIKSIANLYSPANKVIYEEASVAVSTCPSGYLNYYYAIKQSEQTGVAKEVTTENITGQSSHTISGNSYTLSQLQSYSFLVNEFYTVDRTTYIDEQLLNSETLLNTDLRIDKSKATILIYHTHSQESFIDSNENDPKTSIVAVGEYLAKLLNQSYGFNVIHNTKVYDLVDGKLDRNKAYTYAGNDLEQILADNPDIEVIIDLHRDGIDGEKMTTFIDGKETAKLMFFNGLSRTVETGEIKALYNPNLEGNLAMSFQSQLVANLKYPGLMRHIYLKGYQYNLHLKPRSLLIEAGSQKNTFQEMLNAMEPLADILNDVLTKETTFNTE